MSAVRRPAEPIDHELIAKLAALDLDLRVLRAEARTCPPDLERIEGAILRAIRTRRLLLNSATDAPRESRGVHPLTGIGHGDSYYGQRKSKPRPAPRRWTPLFLELEGRALKLGK